MTAAFTGFPGTRRPRSPKRLLNPRARQNLRWAVLPLLKRWPRHNEHSDGTFEASRHSIRYNAAWFSKGYETT